MKLLLLNLPKNLDNRFDYDQVAQPIGLASISAFLKQGQRDVTLFDAHAYHWERKRILNYVKKMNPGLIGLSVMTYQLPVIVSFLKDLKNILPEVVVVLGGPHMTTESVPTLENYDQVDIAVCGEGERTLRDLVHALESGEDLARIEGIAYRMNKEIKVNPPRKLIPDLDRLPYPDWSSLPIEKYWDVFTTRKNYARINASRGCPYGCTFCGAHVAMGKKTRKRSPEHIIGELEMLYDQFKVREFLFNDSTFNIDNHWVSEICQGIIAMKRPMTWRCNVRADKLDQRALRLMKQSGCVKVIMGIESGDEGILKNMRKGETLEQIKEGLRILEEVGMPSDHGFILGMPGETEETMKKTIRFAKEIRSSVVTFSLATPFPGTRLYEQAKREGLTVDDWSTFDFYGVPYVPQGLAREQLQKYYRYAVRSFYLRPSYLLRRLFEMRSWINLKINLWYAFRIFQRRFRLSKKFE